MRLSKKYPSLLLLLVLLIGCKKDPSKEEDKIVYPYTLKAKEITSASKVRMITGNGEVFDDAIIAAFLKRQGGLSMFKIEPLHQIEFLSADSAKIDFAEDIYKIEILDTNAVIFRSDVQLMSNAYSSTALQRELLKYKLNRYNRNLRAIPQAGPLKEMYRCELGYFGYKRDSYFVLPAFNYKLNLYSRAGYFNGSFYGMYNLTFPAELLPRDTLAFQELRIGFSK